jgi:hypothetical protein
MSDTLRGPFVVPKEVVDDLEAGKLPIQGDGSCAKLPQIMLGGQMGLTSEWVAVQNVTDFVNGSERGTVIATMNEAGRYPNARTGKHVAIFLNFVYSPDGRVSGMRVINQWDRPQKPVVSIIRMPPNNTPLPKVPSKEAIRDMRTY